MADDFLKGETCEFCGKQATRVNFARFLCESEDCIDKAYNERGGPGGHRLGKE